MIRRITAADREIYLQMAHDFYHSEAVLHPVPDEYLARSFDEMMRSEALKAARASRFNIDNTAPEKHTGTITYTFIPQ